MFDLHVTEGVADMSAESNLFFEDTVFVCDRTTQE